jgi:quercetin dioxygenase-like cupin family protein
LHGAQLDGQALSDYDGSARRLQDATAKHWALGYPGGGKMSFLTLNQIETRELLPGYHARFVHTENMTIAHWHVDAEAEMPRHAHPHEQVTNVIAGRFAFDLDGDVRTIGPGEVVVIPPHVPHGGRSLSECRLLDVFYPVREEYR